MSAKQLDRIEVFNKLTSPNGTFDYDRCCQLLGDNYDNFVYFCDTIKLIPEEIDTLDIKELNPKHSDEKKVIFEVTMISGERMQFET